MIQKEENQQNQIPNCETHQKYPSEYICVDQKCQQKQKLVCAKCHISGEHSNHKFQEIDEFKFTVKEITKQHMQKLEQLEINNDLTELIEKQLGDLKNQMCNIIDETTQKFILEIQNVKGVNNAEKLAKYHQFYDPYQNTNFSLTNEIHLRESLALFNGNSKMDVVLTKDILIKKELENKINKKIGDIKFLFTKFTESSLKAVMDIPIQAKIQQQEQQLQQQQHQQKQQQQQQLQQKQQDKNIIIDIVDQEQKDHIIQPSIVNTFQGKKKSIQKVHKGWVNTVLIINDNQFATGSNDATIKIWDIEETDFQKTKLVKMLEGHKKSIYSLININEKENIIASGSLDKTIKVWNYKSGDLIKNLEGHEGSIYCLLKISDIDPYICSGGTDYNIIFWNWQEGDYFNKIKIHTHNVWSLVKLENDIIASGSSDKSIIVRNWQQNKTVRVLTGHTDDVLCLVKLKTDLLVSGSGNQDKSIKVWNYYQGVCLFTLQGHDAPVWSIAQINQYEFITVSYDSTMRFWDLVQKKQTANIRLGKPDSFVTYKQIQNDKYLLLTGGTDFSVNKWY